MNEILIYSDIGQDWYGEGITDNWIKQQLDSMKGESQINVRINSVGGDVFQGFAIHNLLKEHDAEIVVKVDGLAASSASIIAMAGDKIHMADNAMMMIHNPWSMAMGESKDMIKTAELLDKIKDSIVTTYHNKTQIDSDQLSDMMDSETWLTTPEAINQGFADEKEGQALEVMDMTKPWIKNAPKIIKIQPIENKPEEKPEIIEPLVTPSKIAAKSRLLEINL